MKTFAVEYLKHSTLNLGQALQGLRYIYSHPDIDRIAKRGTLRHLVFSIVLRSSTILNDVYFSLFPPHWHHTPEEIKAFHSATVKLWFQYGYCAWRFDENGGYKELSGKEDRRWDPRCK
jgi:hypothetical protein